MPARPSLKWQLKRNAEGHPFSSGRRGHCRAWLGCWLAFPGMSSLRSVHSRSKPRLPSRFWCWSRCSVVMIILLRILRAVLGIPSTGAGWRRRHRLILGERTVTRVLVALAAGEKGEARKEARRARNLLGDSPQTLAACAEAGRLSGREDEAEEAFRALAKQTEARFLGLRGLLRQAVDRRDWSEALVIAKQAEAAHPGTLWLRQQRAELGFADRKLGRGTRVDRAGPASDDLLHGGGGR